MSLYPILRQLAPLVGLHLLYLLLLPHFSLCITEATKEPWTTKPRDLTHLNTTKQGVNSGVHDDNNGTTARNSSTNQSTYWPVLQPSTPSNKPGVNNSTEDPPHLPKQSAPNQLASPLHPPNDIVLSSDSPIGPTSISVKPGIGTSPPGQGTAASSHTTLSVAAPNTNTTATSIPTSTTPTTIPTTTPTIAPTTTTPTTTPTTPTTTPTTTTPTTTTIPTTPTTTPTTTTPTTLPPVTKLNITTPTTRAAPTTANTTVTTAATAINKPSPSSLPATQEPTAPITEMPPVQSLSTSPIGTATTTTSTTPVNGSNQTVASGMVEVASSALANQLVDTASLLAVLLFGLLFFLVTVAVFVTQAYESYRRKDYTQVDYLINGMYTDSGV